MLYRLKDKYGVWVEGHYNVMADIEEYFRGIYVQADGVNGEECFHVIPQCVTADMSLKLMARVSSSEVERSVFSLGALKAPSADSLNVEFFQKNWEVIKEDVTAVVCDFFSPSYIGDTVNDT